MRKLIRNLLVTTALVLFSASNANAISTYMTSDYTGPSATGGDVITLQVFLNADQIGIQLLSVGIQFDNSVFQYVPQAGINPTYILYGMSGTMTSVLYPQQDPWELWPGATPPGTSQVNINWLESALGYTYVTELNVLIGVIQLEVLQSAPVGSSTIVLTGEGGGNILRVSDVNGFAPTSGNFAVNVIPEPATAALVGLGFIGLGVLARRRSA